MSDTLSVSEAKEQLDSKRDDIMRERKRYYDKQRSIHHVSIVKEVQEKTSRLVSKGSAVWNYPIHEASTEMLHIKDNYSVKIPTKDYVERISTRMFKQIQSGYRYLGKSIEETITDKKVIKYHPIDVSMDQVQKMDDLVMVYGLDNTTDCKKVVRVIECGEHMGLITKMWNRPIKDIISNRKINAAIYLKVSN
ncbi:hypothetical protein IWW39_005985 [Coemansia spiralis]|uniref:Uncharacterized protein n=1 Tax=Coemansia spiralis TaxID=417178 RepID=A0A9W8GG04_9FUNG|nr:hypothetical protein IWW39_005985 [Coemansia spiralis]